MEILSKEKIKILAGGTDVIIQSRHNHNPQVLLNLSSLPDLQGIEETAESITIKGATTFSHILDNPIIKKEFPILWEACSRIGSKQIRNRATIAGNIVNAAPCADSVPPLIIYGAELILQSQKGKRSVPAAEFVQGSYRTLIESDEILTEIVIPKLEKDKRYVYHYYQLGRRNAVNITRMSISAMILMENMFIKECRLVDGSLFSKPPEIDKNRIHAA